MKMLGKIWKKLEISQENFYDGVSFSKFTILQYSDSNFGIKRTHQYVPKTSCLKKIKGAKVFLEKKVHDGSAT